ncbi:hypothetical protein H6P81_017358 [Aristolochia fimbriata]|uniref:DUF674 family protein n=1 Tax=Aristolochia fimbriata TaxID=158543 RepID=A0AAV7DZP0_ARIFI|nr:hypothetical protein H6P81_017358 [Aristolochia fimbriata]
MAAEKKISLKLMVDKERKRVVCAETGGDFVDVVFSFLTMPTGTVVRLSTKESKMGSMDGLYRSIEKLDEEYFHTPPCKAMLLRPRYDSQPKCDKLAVKIHDPVYPLYCCLCCHVSQYYRNKCYKCGETMSCASGSLFDKVNGVFIKGRVEFVLKDDMQVIPVSAASSLSILEKLEIREETVLVQKDIEFGREEAINLLKCFLLSRTALTDCFLSKLPHESTELGRVIKPAKTKKTGKEAAKKTVGDSKIRMMQGKLIMRKSSNEALYLEAREDLINFIGSFLTFPLGLVAKLVGGHSLLGCAGNLYQSIQKLKTKDHFNSKESKTELLCPKLPYLMGCDDQLFVIEEVDNPHKNLFFTAYAHSMGGSFMKASSEFLLTDDLTVLEPFSPSAAFSLLKKLDVPLHDLKELDITIGAEEAVKLLRAAMTSKNVLTVNGVFVKGRVEFVVKDDMQFIPVSAASSLSILEKLEIREETVLEQKDIEFGREEAREDLINFIGSFLTFPLGLVAKLVGGYSLPGSVGSLYQTVEELKTDDHLSSKESKTELLSPKLPYLMGCDDQLLGVEEADNPYINQLFTKTCPYTMGGSFMKASSKFLLTDDLTVLEPFSPSAAFSLLKKLNVPLHDLKELDITIGAVEAVKLLRAAMTSTTVLTDVFCPKKEEHFGSTKLEVIRIKPSFRLVKLRHRMISLRST